MNRFANKGDPARKAAGARPSSMKGQVSTEQLFMTGVGLIFVGAMLFMSVTVSTDTVREILAKDTVQRIVKSADLVYSMGPGAKTTLEIIMPDNVRAINVSGNRILLTVAMAGGNADIYAYSDGQLNGTLLDRPGQQIVTLNVDNSSRVQVNSTG